MEATQIRPSMQCYSLDQGIVGCVDPSRLLMLGFDGPWEFQ